MIRVVVVKSGTNVGWFKDLNAGVQVIKTTCENNSFDVAEYELRDYDSGLLLWSGEKSLESPQNVHPSV